MDNGLLIQAKSDTVVIAKYFDFDVWWKNDINEIPVVKLDENWFSLPIYNKQRIILSKQCSHS